MARDIDYAAITVKQAIVEKYGRQADLANLEVTALDRSIAVRDGQQAAEGTRDDLLAAVRGADSYAAFWAVFVGNRP